MNFILQSYQSTRIWTTQDLSWQAEAHIHTTCRTDGKSPPLIIVDNGLSCSCIGPISVLPIFHNTPSGKTSLMPIGLSSSLLPHGMCNPHRYNHWRTDGMDRQMHSNHYLSQAPYICAVAVWSWMCRTTTVTSGYSVGYCSYIAAVHLNSQMQQVIYTGMYVEVEVNWWCGPSLSSAKAKPIAVCLPYTTWIAWHHSVYTWRDCIWYSSKSVMYIWTTGIIRHT